MQVAITHFVNGSFTMRVDELFTASHQLLFTNIIVRPVKTLRSLECGARATWINSPAT